MYILWILLISLQTIYPIYSWPQNRSRFTRATENERKLTRRGSYNMTNSSSSIIFLDENDTFFQNFEKRISSTCPHNICEDVDNYPAERIDNIVSRSKEFSDFFQYQTQEIPAFDVNDRININGLEPEENTLCEKMVKTIYPRIAMNLDGTEMLLVNTDRHKQGLVTETCQTTGSLCKFSSSFPNDYETGCKEKYTNHKLLAIGKDGNNVVDVFPIPSCCVCYYKKKST